MILLICGMNVMWGSRVGQVFLGFWIFLWLYNSLFERVLNSLLSGVIRMTVDLRGKLSLLCVGQFCILFKKSCKIELAVCTLLSCKVIVRSLS